MSGLLVLDDTFVKLKYKRFKLSGNVTDPDGVPLANRNIAVMRSAKVTTKSDCAYETTTDANGDFEIVVRDNQLHGYMVIAYGSPTNETENAAIMNHIKTVQI